MKPMYFFVAALIVLQLSCKRKYDEEICAPSEIRAAQGNLFDLNSIKDKRLRDSALAHPELQFFEYSEYEDSFAVNSAIVARQIYKGLEVFIYHYTFQRSYAKLWHFTQYLYYNDITPVYLTDSIIRLTIREATEIARVQLTDPWFGCYTIQKGIFPWSYLDQTRSDHELVYYFQSRWGAFVVVSAVTGQILTQWNGIST